MLRKSLLALCLAPLVLSVPAFTFHDDQSPIQVDGALSVPGENPLTFCQKPDGDILTIERVDLSPNPPLPGETLTVKATGTFAKDVKEGAKVFLKVKYGYITLLKQESDLCEQIENVDMHCPLKEGEMTFVKDIDLPKEIPPGKYSVLADVYTEVGDPITCLQAEVEF